MNRIFLNTTRRIALAIALSVLAHGLLLLMPPIQLPVFEKNLPPLEAKLVPIPIGKASSRKHKAKTQAAPQPEPISQTIPDQPIAASAPVAASEPAVASSPLAARQPAASDPVAASAPIAVSEPVAPTAPVAAVPVVTAPETVEAQRPPVPKHAKLNFSVYLGDGGFKVGESVHTLDIVDGHYTLKADAHTTGLVHVFKTYHIEQTSSGTATAQTLKPDTFTEIITQSGDKEINRGDFDWANKKIHFSNGTEASLPPLTMDILSTLYQFPPMRELDQIVTINIATAKYVESYRFQVDVAEPLKTSMGTLQTVHFRRVHKAHQEGLEIWFAQEYRLLPVKVRHIDNDGKIDGEAIISEIRVSDE
jgi:hypothetical protein